MEPTLKRRRSTPSITSCPMSPKQAPPPPTSPRKNSKSRSSDAVPRTPQRSKKRVRFSDPGPELSKLSSTGLTPAVQRCTMKPTGLLSATPRRRAQSFGSKDFVPVLTYDLTDDSDEIIQFFPLRQLLSPRTRRRLRRNSLSEEMNDIEAERRHERRSMKLENEDLKEELVKKEEQLQILKEVPELARFIDTDRDSYHSNSDEGCNFVHTSEDEEVFRGDTPPTPSSLHNGTAQISGVDTSFLRGIEGADIGPQRSASTYLDTPPETPKAPRYQGATASAGVQCDKLDEEKEALQDALVVHKSALERMSSTIEDVAQVHQRFATKLGSYTTFEDPALASTDLAIIDEALDNLLTAVVLAESKSEDTDKANESLLAEIQSLGFPGDGPENIIKGIRSHFREARLSLEFVCPGETIGGFDNPKLLPLLLGKIKSLLGQIQDRDLLLDEQRSSDAKLYEQINEKSQVVDNLRSQNFDLERSVDEKDRSVQKLKIALESYRLEISSLEHLVMRIEAEFKDNLSNAKTEHDEAVADLETRLNTEIGRREELEWSMSLDQLSVESLHERLAAANASLESTKTELQAVLRAREDDLAAFKKEMKQQQQQHGANLASRDAHKLALRKQNDELTHALTDAKHVIVGLEAAKKVLEGKIGRESGAEVVKSLLPDVKSLLGAMEKVSNGNQDAEPRKKTKRRAELVQVDDTFVKPRLGFNNGAEEETGRKKRAVRDSGIGGLDEDEDQIMADY